MSPLAPDLLHLVLKHRRSQPNRVRWAVALLLPVIAALSVVVGCSGPGREVTWLSDSTLEYYRDRELYLAAPAEEPASVSQESWQHGPRTVTAPTEDTIRDLPLAETLRLALENNSVVRTRGGFLSPGNTILSSPDRVASIWDPAIQETGVMFGGRGVTASLAAFDPEFTTTMLWGRNETPQNNSFFGGGVSSGQALVAESGAFSSMIRKQMGYGASFSVGHDWNYLGSNVPSAYQLFNSTYTGNVNLRYRQPLLAGSGTEFTQIAGPVANQFRGLSGVSQGVLIARINNDLTLTQFELSAINLVKDAEDLYWDLYLAYRKWDTAVMARNSAQKSWRDTKLILEAGGRPGTTPADEAQARDRYFQTRAQAQAALSTLYRSETALRRLLGMPVNDGTVLRPSDEPVNARFVPDWKSSLVEALAQRVELRRQKWSIRSLELQLKAASSLTRPRLDLVSGYQVNALGDDLFAGSNSGEFAGGYGALSQGDHTGWNLGVELTLPLGMRSAHAQVRNLELRVVKARAVLATQEMEISHELADAFQQLAAHDTASRSNFNRQEASRQRVKLFEAEVKAGTKTLDQLLRAQASLADAEVAYFTSLVAYNQALTNLHYRSGTLLAVNNVQLAESEWTPGAYRDALRRAWQRTYGLHAGSLLEDSPSPITGPGPESVLPEAEAKTPDDGTAEALEPLFDPDAAAVGFGDRDDQDDGFKMPRPVGFSEPQGLPRPQ
ncbi:MAG: TolC family protein [Planctomycetaceae bacterium]|nr:TolC family protein [Planctomycetaceae bacterium]